MFFINVIYIFIWVIYIYDYKIFCEYVMGIYLVWIWNKYISMNYNEDINFWKCIWKLFFKSYCYFVVGEVYFFENIKKEIVKFLKIWDVIYFLEFNFFIVLF